MLIISIFIVLLLISKSDIKERRIPNFWLALLLVFTTLYGMFLAEYSWLGRLIGGLCVGCFLLLVNAIRPHSFGMGDVKLMMASGMMLGICGNILAFVIAVVIAGVYSIIGMLMNKINRKSNIAFGPFLSIGIMISLIISVF